MSMRYFIVILMSFIGIACQSVSETENPLVPDPNVLWGTHLDVGQGLSVLMLSHSQALLYDTGRDSAGLADTLLRRGVDTLHTVVISHWHEDHYNGFLGLAQAVQEGRLHIGRLLYGADLGNESNRLRILERCQALHIPTQMLTRGDTLQSLAPFTVRVLWPDSQDVRVGNPGSLVLRLADGLHSWLLVGDLDATVEPLLLQLEPHLRADVLQVGHHGSDDASSWDFLSAVQPRFALIGVDQQHTPVHPGAQTLARLYAVLPDSSHLFRSDHHGSVTFEWEYAVGIWKTDF